MASVKDGHDCGLWHFPALAIVTGCDVCSVFPGLSKEEEPPGWFQFYNNCFSLCGVSDSKQKLHIMWSSMRLPPPGVKYWKGNHFVPLVPISNGDQSDDLPDGYNISTLADGYLSLGTLKLECHYFVHWGENLEG